MAKSSRGKHGCYVGLNRPEANTVADWNQFIPEVNT